MGNSNINITQTELGGKNGKITAVFVEYSGEYRCAKCVFQDSPKKCKSAPCSPDERKDKRRGFFRAANAIGSQYTITDAFKQLVH